MTKNCSLPRSSGATRQYQNLQSGMPGVQGDAGLRPNLNVDIAVLDPAWRWQVTDLEGLVAETLEAALTEALGAGLVPVLAAEARRTWEVSIALGGDDLLRRLNRDYRGRDKATNVLAFAAVDSGAASPNRGSAADGELTARAAEGAKPVADSNLQEAELPLGDIVLSLNRLRREADTQDKALQDHLRHLLVHGFLHLLGWDHQTAPEAADMEALETAALARLGLSDPYAPSAAPVTPAGQDASTT